MFQQKNRQVDFDAFDIQEIKEWGSLFIFRQFLYSLILTFFYSLILADNIVIYLSFVVMNASGLKYAVVTTELLH